MVRHCLSLAFGHMKLAGMRVQGVSGSDRNESPFFVVNPYKYIMSNAFDILTQ
jgi:hypothetical protein